MDFKKILSELVVFQEDYEENTKDKCPGNQYYADKLMSIVNKAKQEINAQETDNALSEGDSDGMGIDWCPRCNEPVIVRPTDNEITIRVIESMWEDDAFAFYDDLPAFGRMIDWLNQSED